MARPAKPSCAALPCHNLRGDPEQEYFADGVVEDIITALSRIRCLFVIARNSCFTYMGDAGDVKQVGRELYAAVVPEHEAFIAEQLAALDSDAQRHLLRMLRRLDHTLV